MPAEPGHSKKHWCRDLMGIRKRHLPPEFCSPLAPCNLPVHRCPVAREEASHRILIMRTGAFGDILMGTPLLAALREAYPNSHLTWLAFHSEVQAIDANPYIDEFIRWDGSYWKKMLRKALYPLWLVRALRFQNALRAKKYDIFVSFQPEEWPLLIRGVGAKITVGIFDTFRRYYKSKSTSRNTRLYTHPYAYPDLPDHRIDQYFLTLRALGLSEDVSHQMSMGYTQEDADVTAQYLTDQGVTESEKLIVLAPMTTWPTKCWPSENYTAFGDALQCRLACRVIVIGSGKERDRLLSVAAKMSTYPILIAGELTFRQMAALVDRADLLVSGDTGPMHVASALKTPQLALFGPTSPRWYGPLGSTAISLIHPVPCGPCDQKFCPNTGADFEKCMRLITVEEALAAAISLLTTNIIHPAMAISS